MKKAINGFGKWDYYEKWNVLYCWKTYMEKRVWTHWLYMIIPFVFTSIIFMLMENDGALIMKGENQFSFFRDSSNSFCMTTLFVLSYYLLPIYPMWVKDAVEAVRGYQNERRLDKILEKIARLVHVCMVLLLFGTLLCLPFVIRAFNQDVGWMKIVTMDTLFVYGVYLCLTWYFSLCLLVYVLTGCYAMRWVLGRRSLSVFTECYVEVRQKLEKVAKCLSVTVSYSAFWVVATIIIIINDNVNIKYGVKMSYYQNPGLVIVTILAMIMGVMYALLPTMAYNKVISEQKDNEMKKVMTIKDAEERKQKMEQLGGINGSVFAKGINKLTLVMSMIIPVFSLVLQLVTDVLINVD